MADDDNNSSNDLAKAWNVRLQERHPRFRDMKDSERALFTKHAEDYAHDLTKQFDRNERLTAQELFHPSTRDRHIDAIANSFNPVTWCSQIAAAQKKAGIY